MNLPCSETDNTITPDASSLLVTGSKGEIMEVKALSLDEHTLIGLELCAIRERLRMISLRIDTSYGRPVGTVGRTAADAVDALREALTRQILQTCPPEYAGTVSSVYQCTERLQALREERDLKTISDRLLGLTG
jgi:hypothetical protein